jgi:hypothetical protein
MSCKHELATLLENAHTAFLIGGDGVHKSQGKGVTKMAVIVDGRVEEVEVIRRWRRG